MAQANPSLKILDCGTGPGTVVASLSKYMPQGTITATDLSPEVVERAASHARDQGVTNMHCQVASIYDFPFGDGEFDVVHAQQVLCHLNQPLEALRSMLRVCKPGGIVALRERDLRMWNWYPDLPGLTEFTKCIRAVMTAAGGSEDMGVRLVSLAMQAGVKREDITATMGTWCYSTREEREMWGETMRDRIKHGEMRRKVLEGNLRWDEGEMDEMAKALREWIEAEDGCFGCMHGEVILRKA
ncbi:hypothetical protein CLAFUW4_10024 [Fulvia fulva]|uniref:Methyltransferase type 11 domain-containing protein n=1 Tax=Passalora fulva TaxID=5499 RepID=A0A9Q8UU43_PASFU|nr:uncharacterized protein CLAFUR5_12220 [Fulvia fulva]KAK4616230.1 hypothetical protein CLAFUR4_10028 [Fulvia fulva]KAK4616934.1 hypothetical protein CLAFUR0_10026 [Fulvia fulva]UJO22526.1 hypothetical protein CLAFUR5_12220 [Fulvia fulva]WPV18862.1 hypothetical protein CLAFUW4_10024 [Fulvia fulva]WPV34618.1 hypothetical protein CLAFUW7_10025 [Fulvia fulva]